MSVKVGSHAGGGGGGGRGEGGLWWLAPSHPRYYPRICNIITVRFCQNNWVYKTMMIRSYEISKEILNKTTQDHPRNIIQNNPRL